MLDPLLSLRGGTTVASLNRPWRFASKPTYDPDTNPEGLISFGMAENVREHSMELNIRETDIEPGPCNKGTCRLCKQECTTEI